MWRPPLPESITWIQCESCTHVFTDGYYTSEGLHILFGVAHEAQLAGGNLEQQRSTWGPVIERVLQVMPLRETVFEGGLTWLDVGCGNGGLVFAAAEYGFQSFGVDARMETVDRIKKMGYSAVQGDIFGIKVEKPLAVVSMADVLEHMAYPVAALRYVFKMLANDGILFVSCPNRDCVSWRQMDREGSNPYWIELEHHHNFSRKVLMWLLRQCGFTPLRYAVSTRYKSCMEIVAKKST